LNPRVSDGAQVAKAERAPVEPVEHSANGGFACATSAAGCGPKPATGFTSAPTQEPPSQRHHLEPPSQRWCAGRPSAARMRAERSRITGGPCATSAAGCGPKPATGFTSASTQEPPSQRHHLLQGSTEGVGSAPPPPPRSPTMAKLPRKDPSGKDQGATRKTKTGSRKKKENRKGYSQNCGRNAG